MKACLVLTTIAEPVLLEKYHANLEQFGHLDDASVVVIPDRKTPAAASDRCEALVRQGMHVSCPSLEEQDAFLARVGMPPHLVPYNSDNRRNVGFLMALESGADFLISIDDDNYCRDGEDFFAEHAIVCGEAAERTVVESSTGYLNACALLDFGEAVALYPRGFPYYARHKSEQVRFCRTSAAVHINAGLWLRDPDIDGITWLVSGARATYFRGPSMVLGRSTWSPVNSQNTALRREAIPSYYFIKMGYTIGGLEIDRYGDIFSGYFAEACAKHLGGHIRLGTPIADHIRNSHNYLKDAGKEWSCILLLEDLLPWLQETELSGGTYLEAYRWLSHAIDEAAERFTGSIWTDASRGFIHEMTDHMRAWLKACETILAP